MTLFNIVFLVLLTLLIENGLRKIIEANSVPATRIYWFYLLPTYILTTIFTVLLLLTPAVSGSIEILLTLQKYAFGAHLLACLLFIGAVYGARMNDKATQAKEDRRTYTTDT